MRTSISRERGPGRGAVIIPRDLFEEKDWSSLANILRKLAQSVETLQSQVQSLQQQTNQPIWTVVQVSDDYDFPAAFIRVEIDATAGNKTATLPLSTNLQGQLVNVVKSDSGVNTVTCAPQGSDALFLPALSDVLTTQWDGVVLIGVPGGWSIFAVGV